MNPEYTAPDRPLRAWTRHPALARLADALQPAVRALLDGDEPVRRACKNVLHGTYLGHALHPLLTDIPIGAWTVTAVCDALELTGCERYRDAAGAALTVGAAGAVAAAITGLADWSDTKGEPQRTGMLHALLNTAALGAYVVSLAARKRGARRAALLSAFGGYAVMTVSAYFGGELSFDLQLGVKHSALATEPPADFVAPDQVSIPLLLTGTGEATRAVGGVCTHRGAPLAEGTFEDGCVRCPWHGSRFSLDDGRVVEGPATFGLPVFETRAAGGALEVRLKS